MKFLKGGVLALLLAACVPSGAQDMPSTMTALEKANVKMILNWWCVVIVAHIMDLAPKYQAGDYI